jgi:acetyl-CoA C-acetyltransferase/acetyl-CoA acyltransferase
VIELRKRNRMRKVAVVGVGETKFSGAQENTEVELFSEAAADALSEANLKPKDVQALYLGNVLGDFAEEQGMVQCFCAENIGCINIPANRYEGACASASIAIRDAFMWVASGFYDIVLTGGTERAATYSIPIEKLREQMAKVSIQSYKYGNLNPKAHFYGKYGDLSVEKVIKSFTVCSPLTLHDCCPFSDGAAAVVLASEEVAKKLTSKPVYITGVYLTRVTTYHDLEPGRYRSSRPTI